MLKTWPRSDDPMWNLLADRELHALEPLMAVRSVQQLRSVVGRVVIDYVPIQAAIVTKVVSQALTKGRTTQHIVRPIHQLFYHWAVVVAALREFRVREQNETTWDALSSLAEGTFSPSDKKTLMDVLRALADLALLADEVPTENRAALLSTIIDGYWETQKLDLCVSTALLIASGELRPQSPEIPHWLCLAANGYLRAWKSIFFLNNPALHHRLTRPVKTMTIEEMEQRLGLQG